ncbi:MAG TPA: hypothetical protein PLW44_15595 [Chitinophagales bacterium]|nr:hypothetical protein [Chitinophagales bacterium]
MTKNIKTLICATAVAGLAFMASCKYTCDLGYEGDNCTTPVREKYLGTFSGNELCGSAADSFNIAISEISNDVTKVRFTNLHNANNQTATGTVLENGSITIPSQAFGSGGNINGTLTMVNGKISVEYLVKIDGLPDAACTWIQK